MREGNEKATNTRQSVTITFHDWVADTYERPATSVNSTVCAWCARIFVCCIAIEKVCVQTEGFGFETAKLGV